MNQTELKTRTKAFALRAIKLVSALPDSTAGRVVGGQLLRAATSTAANYRAACRARSKAEFTAKLGIVLEEADESAFWLEIVIEGGLLKQELAGSLLAEANELTAIFTTATKSARRNLAAERDNRTSAISHPTSHI